MKSVLICNDDGYLSPSLQPLVDYCQRRFESVTVVVPERDNSGVGCSLTVDRPMKIKQYAPSVFIVSGKPVDCINYALTQIDNRPDLIISGINAGHNLCNTIVHSGTIAAALYALPYGIPGICLSADDKNPTWVEDSIATIDQFGLLGLIKSVDHGVVFNINIPNTQRGQCKGVRYTKLGTRSLPTMCVTEDPYGNPMFWSGMPGPILDKGSNTDYYAIANGYISITPLAADLTHLSIYEDYIRRPEHSGA